MLINTLALTHAACGSPSSQPGAHVMEAAAPALLAAPGADPGVAVLDAGWDAYYAGRFADAEAEFRRLLEADPGAIEPRVGLAWSLLGAGELADARELLEEVLAGEPENGAALAGYGRLLEKLGEVDGAIAAWTRMAAAVPGPHEGVVSLARVYLDRGDCAAAQPYLERMLDGLPPDWAVDGLERCMEKASPGGYDDGQLARSGAVGSAAGFRTGFRS